MEWLHTRWPAGTVEPIPESRPDGATAIEGVRIAGDLTGIPLLKFSSDTGARAAAAAAGELAGETRPADPELLDLAIVGGGVSGMAAALEARRRGLRFAVFEAAEPFSTVANFPAGKPIFTFPSAMTPAGELQFCAEVHPKEELLASLEAQRRAAGIEPVIARIESVERRDGALLLHAEGSAPIRARRVIVATRPQRRLSAPGSSGRRLRKGLQPPVRSEGLRGQERPRRGGR
jgi:alkyl hydroperoxide reductase subunit AhpF